MPLHPTWQDIALRLVLTMIAGGIIGFNRGVRGEAAGLRTTILVGLAASVAMVQGNIGVGFIGGGAILRRGDLVIGVTTAATLWLITIIGLCFGGGQLGLGVAATLLGVATLWTLRWLDIHIPREQRAMLEIRTELGTSSPSQLTELIAPLGYEAQFRRQQNDETKHTTISFDIGWRRPEIKGAPTDLLQLVNEHFPNSSFEMTTEARH